MIPTAVRIRRYRRDGHKPLISPPSEPLGGSNMTRVTIDYRDHFVDLEDDGQRCRIVSIEHRIKGSSLMLPLYEDYPDRAMATLYARGAIDVQLSKRIRPVIHRPRIGSRTQIASRRRRWITHGAALGRHD